MSYLQRIEACNRFDLSRYLPFWVDGVRLGWVLPEFASHLRAWPNVFEFDDAGVTLAVGLREYAQRSEAVRLVVEQLAGQGIITGWRNENYPVTLNYHQPGAFEVERAAVPHFGFRAFGVHVNGLVRQGNEVKVWVGQRAKDKPTFPGMLDHLAAGGQPVGISQIDNVIKECGEEAGVPSQLAANAVRVRDIAYCCDSSTGLKPDTMTVFDLYLPESFVPQNTDGEVESFSLWTMDEVAHVVATTERFKPNCNLVLIDLLMRHGKLGVDSQLALKISGALLTPELP